MQNAGERTRESVELPHVHALFQTALHLVGDRERASRIVQDVLVPAGKHGRLELFRKLISQARRRSRAWFSPSVGATASSKTGNVCEALATLPVSLREPLLLVDCQSFSYQEAAEILGLSAEELSDLLVQARDQLSEQLKALEAPSSPVESFSPQSENLR